MRSQRTAANSASPFSVTVDSIKVVETVFLDPEIEFDAVLIAMKKMHDAKSAGYGTGDNPLQNFYDIGRQMGVSPFFASEVLLAKHQSALKQWFGSDSGKTPTSNDAIIDRAVYAVISKVLYDRLGPDA